MSSIKYAFKTAKRLYSHALLIYVILSANQCQWVNAKVCFSDEISLIYYTLKQQYLFSKLWYTTQEENNNIKTQKSNGLFKTERAVLIDKWIQGQC